MIYSKYTDISERSDLLQTLLALSIAVLPEGISDAARGDLLEATFQTMDGVPDSGIDHAFRIQSVTLGCTSHMFAIFQQIS